MRYIISILRGANNSISDWPRFVAIQAGRWFSMLDHWTKHSSPREVGSSIHHHHHHHHRSLQCSTPSPSLPIQVLVIHYENIQSDIAGSLRTLLRFLGLPEDEARVACVERHQRGFFKRRRHDEPEVVAFKKPLRSQVRTSQSSDFIPRRVV